MPQREPICPLQKILLQRLNTDPTGTISSTAFTCSVKPHHTWKYVLSCENISGSMMKSDEPNRVRHFSREWEGVIKEVT